MSGIERLATTVLGVGFIIVALALSAGCREQRISSCRERGGQPVIPAWFSGEPHDVRCIER